MTGYGSGRVGRDRFDSSPLDDDEDVERERIRRAELRDREADRRHDEEAIYGPRARGLFSQGLTENSFP